MPFNATTPHDLQSDDLQSHSKEEEDLQPAGDNKEEEGLRSAERQQGRYNSINTTLLISGQLAVVENTLQELTAKAKRRRVMIL